MAVLQGYYLDSLCAIEFGAIQQVVAGQIPIYLKYCLENSLKLNSKQIQEN